MPFPIGKIVSDALGPVTDMVDDLFTSDQERKKAERLMQKVKQRMQSKLLDVKQKLIEQRGRVVVAEAKGESWLQRSWRPITMLVFVVLIVLHWLGVAGTQLPPGVQQSVYDLIKLGLTGYVVGRSAEKVTDRWSRGKEAERNTQEAKRMERLQEKTPDSIS
jgi:Flp pilus assembly protein TadB